MRLTVLKNNVPINDVRVDTPEISERYEIYVGRSEDCHVRIDDPLISRHHFVIKNENGIWWSHKKTQLGMVSVDGKVGDVLNIENGSEIKCGIYSFMVSELSNHQLQRRPEYAASALSTESLPEIEELDQSRPESFEELSPEMPDDLSAASVPELDDLSSPEPDYSAGEESVEEVGNSFADSENQALSTEYADPGEDIDSQFGDSDLPVDSFSGESAPSNLTGTVFDRNFINYQLVLFGEHAPYDRFLISMNEVFIGRDNKKCQIILNDPEVSTVHAVLRKNGSEIILEDLNSSNGTILNGERINRAQIMTGDEFVIGGTSFTLEVRSELLDSESDRLMPVERGQVIEKEEIEEVEVSMDEGTNFTTVGTEEKNALKRIWKNPEQRKKIIMGLVVLTIMVVVLYEEPEDKPPVKVAPKTTVANPNAKPKIQLSKELENRRNIAYELGVSFFEQNKYFEALKEFQVVAEIDPEYKKIQTYLEQTKVGLKRLEELEADRRAEEERIKTKKIIEDLLVKAREAVKDKKVTVAQSLFSQITEKDPENIEVQQLKMELDEWEREQQRIAIEKATKEAARKRMVDALAPGKTFYLKKEWYRAILKLEEFLRIKQMDEDLIKSASEMLGDAKNQLASELGPLLGKARSLKEGQDLKSAYEAFLDVLKLEPTNAEALNEVDDIRSQLENRSKKIYREAIIAESLSLFNDAKEKFQEVQQVSPTDSEYYRKASEKLKNYLE